MVDDAPDFRLLVRTILSRNSDFEVCGEGGTGLDAIDLAQRLRPDVVLVDLSMPGIDGIEAMGQILQRSPETRVVVISGYGDSSYVETAMGMGALGWLEKDVGVANLADRLLELLDPRDAERG